MKVKKVRNLKSKKSVSPLIATVLLIAFAVALGAVVMNWSKSYFETTTQYATEKSDTARMCAMDVSLGVLKVGSEQKICYNVTTYNVEVTLENKGSIDLDRLKTSIILTDGNIYTNETIDTLSEVEIQRFDVNFESGLTETDVDNIEQIRITPGAEGEYCPDATISFRSITACD